VPEVDLKMKMIIIGGNTMSDSKWRLAGLLFISKLDAVFYTLSYDSMPHFC
jgi:hypothetical protein